MAHKGTVCECIPSDCSEYLIFRLQRFALRGEVRDAEAFKSLLIFIQ